MVKESEKTVHYLGLKQQLKSGKFIFFLCHEIFQLMFRLQGELRSASFLLLSLNECQNILLQNLKK